MQAAVFHEPGKPLSIENVDDPVCGPGELILKVKQCGICGTDLHASNGGAMLPPCGTIFGHEFSGEIVEIGRDSHSSWRIGQPAVALPFISCGKCRYCLNGNAFFCSDVQRTGLGVGPQGGYAEYVRVGSAESLAIPKGVSWDFATLVEPLAVGLHGVNISKFRPGHRALVVGAGPIGIATIKWLRNLGARDIMVMELSDDRKAMAEELDITGIIDASLHPKEIADIYQKSTGAPPDIIFECVGLPGVLNNCVQIAAPMSEIVILGVCDKPDTFTPFLGTMKELTIKFAVAYLKDDFQYTLSLLEQGRINPINMISNHANFNSLPSIFEGLKTEKDQCKVLFSPEC